MDELEELDELDELDEDGDEFVVENEESVTEDSF